VVVVGNDRAASGIGNLRPGTGGIARNQRTGQGEGAATIGHATTTITGGIARDGTVEHREGAASIVCHPTAVTTAIPREGAITGDGTVEDQEGAKVRHPSTVVGAVAGDGALQYRKRAGVHHPSTALVDAGVIAGNGAVGDGEG